MRAFLMVSCVAGIVIPYWFALHFFVIHGANFGLFFEEMFATRISSFFCGGSDCGVGDFSGVVVEGFARARDFRLVDRVAIESGDWTIAGVAAVPVEAD